MILLGLLDADNDIAMLKIYPDDNAFFDTLSIVNMHFKEVCALLVVMFSIPLSPLLFSRVHGSILFIIDLLVQVDIRVLRKEHGIIQLMQSYSMNRTFVHEMTV